MADIIDLDRERQERTPHLSGEARCLLCDHEWVAVAPVGTTWLDCPLCGLEYGRMAGHVAYSGMHWTCSCGNDLFRLSDRGFPYCPMCGDAQSWPPDAPPVA